MAKDLNQLFDEFMTQQYAEKKSQATMRGYFAAFELLKSKFPDLTFGKLSSQTISSFFKWLDTRERRVGKFGRIVKQGVKPSTVGTYRSKLNVFFNWLELKNFIKENPFKFIKYPKIRYEDRKHLNKEEYAAIIIALDLNIQWANLLVEKRNKAMIVFARATGVRKEELLGLKYSDIDFKKRTVHIRAETSKSKRSRTLSIHPQALQKLEDYLKERRDKKTEFLWVSNNQDAPLTEHGLKHLVGILKKVSGVKDFHLHRLRHTFAVNYYLETKDLVGLQRLLGHAELKMTMKYLRGLPEESTKEALENMRLEGVI